MSQLGGAADPLLPMSAASAELGSLAPHAVNPTQVRRVMWGGNNPLRLEVSPVFQTDVDTPSHWKESRLQRKANYSSCEWYSVVSPKREINNNR